MEKKGSRKVGECGVPPKKVEEASEQAEACLRILNRRSEKENSNILRFLTKG
jgi:hypothetical protein